MKKIVWLASYPKSGNTWLRAFLSYYSRDDIRENDFINELIAPIFSSRKLIEDELCIETSELTIEELDELRPLAFTSYVQNQDVNPVFIKIHDAYTYTQSGQPLIPHAPTIGAIYIVRNPLDVAVSYAHHCNLDMNAIIRIMAEDSTGSSGNNKKINVQIHQTLLSWHSHVKSWLGQEDIPILLVRYEDMYNDSFNTFSRILQFTGLPIYESKLNAAIEKTSFNKLQQQEQRQGFKERTQQSKLFFRKGKIGSWQDELNSLQVKQIIRDHYDVMFQLNYINSFGHPIS